MDALKIAAILLILADALALGYGGFSFTKDTHEAKLGSLSISIDKKQQVNVPIWAGVAAISSVGSCWSAAGKASDRNAVRDVLFPETEVR